jgi:hypothetical protein
MNTQPLPVERYLIELIFPCVEMAYKDQVWVKQLNEADIEYLVRSRFATWMNYLINLHFRVQLNVSQTTPVPHISDLDPRSGTHNWRVMD